MTSQLHLFLKLIQLFSVLIHVTLVCELSRHTPGGQTQRMHPPRVRFIGHAQGLSSTWLSFKEIISSSETRAWTKLVYWVCKWKKRAESKEEKRKSFYWQTSYGDIGGKWRICMAFRGDVGKEWNLHEVHRGSDLRHKSMWIKWKWVCVRE